ncbi:hypothetical protein IAT40_004267 [Kwoniella sp. CBS 6097]
MSFTNLEKVENSVRVQSLSLRDPSFESESSSTLSPSLFSEVNTLHSISAIHPHLLDILRHSSPALFIRVSKAFCDDLIPSIYRHVHLTEENVWGVLEGARGRRKAEALELVRDLNVDLDALRMLAVSDAGCSVADSGSRLSSALGDSGDVTDASSDESTRSEQQRPPTSDCWAEPPFTNVERLHILWSIINTLSAEMHSTNSNPDAESGMETTTSGSDISALSQALAQYVRPAAIHLDLRGLVAASYWALDSVITSLLSKLIETAFTSQRNLSLEIEITLPPVSPESGYIPHRLSVPSVIRFRPHPTARAKHYAKVIRDHYDVHTSRDRWPTIEYWVDDLNGVREELGKMVEARIRVPPELMMDEVDSGVLRQVSKI